MNDNRTEEVRTTWDPIARISLNYAKSGGCLTYSLLKIDSIPINKILDPDNFVYEISSPTSAAFYFLRDRKNKSIQGNVSIIIESRPDIFYVKLSFDGGSVERYIPRNWEVTVEEDFFGSSRKIKISFGHVIHPVLCLPFCPAAAAPFPWAEPIRQQQAKQHDWGVKARSTRRYSRRRGHDGFSRCAAHSAPAAAESGRSHHTDRINIAVRNSMAREGLRRLQGPCP